MWIGPFWCFPLPQVPPSVSLYKNRCLALRGLVGCGQQRGRCTLELFFHCFFNFTQPRKGEQEAVKRQEDGRVPYLTHV